MSTSYCHSIGWLSTTGFGEETEPAKEHKQERERERERASECVSQGAFIVCRLEADKELDFALWHAVGEGKMAAD